MRNFFSPTGEMTGVTKIQAGPCFVTQVKTGEVDGYQAVQLGFEEKKRKEKNPVKGDARDRKTWRALREFRVEKTADYKKGQTMDVSLFLPQELVTVVSFSKGKGFQGVMRRHHFHGAPATHGTKDQHRMPGSAGPTFPQHVIKGRRMPGRMGFDQVTVKNLEIVKVEPEKNEMWVKGAVPGPYKSLLLISGTGEKAKVKHVIEEVAEEKEKKEKGKKPAAKK